uniref:Uncharacterized protein n=1 Tax=Anguilla anguilla TaxID=7936 RepID=A0A0E9T0U5_ANGAN
MWHAGDLFIYNSGCMVVVIVHTQRTIYLPKLSTFCSKKKKRSNDLLLFTLWCSYP